MLELRSSGWSLPALARKYDVYDHSAIQYHCKRHGIYFGHENKKNLTVFYHSSEPTIRAIISTVLVWWLPEEEKINPGKSYKEYIQEYNLTHERPLAIPTSTTAIELPIIHLSDTWS